MAYNPYFQYQGYQYPQQQQQSSFVPVRSIEEAYNYPVAPGNSITFKDENNPFVYTKTKGFSPLEPPVFERYRLVKVEEPQEPASKGFDCEGQIKQLWNEVNALKGHFGKEDSHDKHADNTADQAVHSEPAGVHPSNEYSRRIPE